MKSIVLRTGLLTGLILLGWSYNEASAASAWPSKCVSYGEIKPNQNPSLQHMNCLLTNAALEAKIPPEVVKAVATQENGWRQFDGNGQPVVSKDGGIGLMQITNQAGYDQQKLKYDIYYNIQAGVEILSSMYQRTDLPKIKGAEPEVIENWYFPVMAYNGTKPMNSPLYQSTGAKNINAYQEKVFALLEQNSFLGSTKLGQFPFSTADFEYDPNSNKNIVFKKMEYTLTDQMHASAHLLQTGDQVVVTGDNVKLRSQPSTSSVWNVLAKNTVLIIQGNFSYDQSASSKNQFVWYPVKTVDQKLAGYISSAYIMKKLDAPSVDPVDDNDVSLSGKAPAGATIQIMNGTKLIGSTAADANGYFKAGIPVQKAGTQLKVAYKDKLNALSPSTTITVTDKTAPSAPKVNVITSKDKVVTGTAEANTLVYVKVGSTIIGRGKTDAAGKFSVAVPVQKAGTKVGVVVQDSAGNYSPYAVRVVG
ncbi:Ig-like domain-containing protein [Ectobacillus panaciterrae]|uniref:Ig-like domain-containing protein n=1 Tax=Ectobacillus panaciterrae TaxID=363872 RepID=UPI0003FB363F|nr:Ig-like domain-containing protein [Ectobacillus panaciterrae]